jgi:hypothetical protein
MNAKNQALLARTLEDRARTLRASKRNLRAPKRTVRAPEALLRRLLDSEPVWPQYSEVCNNIV